MKRLLVLTAAAVALIVATALAETGALKPKDCVTDKGNNAGHFCDDATKGLGNAYKVAVSNDGKSAYAIGFQDDAIVTFKRNSKGKLTPKGSCIADPDDNPDDCSKTAEGIDTPTGLAISRDGKSVYVTGRNSDSVAIFKRDKDDGSLKSKGCIVDEDQPADGCKRTAQELADPQQLVVSRDGKSVYVASDGDNGVAWLKRDKDNGSLKGKGCVGNDTSNFEACPETMKGLEDAFSIAISKDGDSVYVGSETNAVGHLERSGNGALDGIGCVGDVNDNVSGCGATFKGLQGVRGVAVTDDGNSVYATGENSNSIVHFERDGSTGNLDSIGCFGQQGDNPANCGNTAIGLGMPTAVTTSPDNKSVYVGSYGSLALTWLTRDRSTGNLTANNCVASTTDNPDGCADEQNGIGRPSGLTVSSDGKSLYSAGDTSSSIVHFKRTN